MELRTIAEIAKILGIPESTARFYRNEFEPYIPSVGEGRSRRYPPAGLEALRFIATAMKNATPRQAIEAALQTKFGVAVQPQPQTAEPQQQDTAMKFMLEMLGQSIRSEFDTLHAEIAAVREENQELRNVIEISIQERDRKLMEVLRAIQESKEEYKKRPWWKFGK